MKTLNIITVFFILILTSCSSVYHGKQDVNWSDFKTFYICPSSQNFDFLYTHQDEKDVEEILDNQLNIIMTDCGFVRTTNKESASLIIKPAWVSSFVFYQPENMIRQTTSEIMRKTKISAKLDISIYSKGELLWRSWSPMELSKDNYTKSRVRIIVNSVMDIFPPTNGSLNSKNDIVMPDLIEIF